MRGFTLVRTTLAAAGCALALGAAPAQADVIWEFTGNCTDCAAAANVASFEVTATLTLENYTEGTPLEDEHFVSFSYGGSNLLYPYLVTTTFPAPPNVVTHGFYSMSGSLETGGSQSLNLSFGDGLEFTLDASGNWFTCGVNDSGYYGVPCSWMQNSDTGVGGNFSVPPPTSVPEPTAVGLLAMSAVGLMRRRSQSRQ